MLRILPGHSADGQPSWFSSTASWMRASSLENVDLAGAILPHMKYSFALTSLAFISPDWPYFGAAASLRTHRGLTVNFCFVSCVPVVAR